MELEESQTGTDGKKKKNRSTMTAAKTEEGGCENRNGREVQVCECD